MERPIAAFILSLLGGLFTTAGGIYNLLYVPTFYYYTGYPPYQTFGVIGVGIGGLLLLAAALLYLLPQHNVAWGIMTAVLGVSSVFSLYGGVSTLGALGLPLAVIGGGLAIAWKPGAISAFEDYRTCLACGRHIRADFAVCPFCGATVGRPMSAPRPPGSP